MGTCCEFCFSVKFYLNLKSFHHPTAHPPILGCNIEVTKKKKFWDLTHHVLRVTFDFISFSFLFYLISVVFSQGVSHRRRFQFHIVLFFWGFDVCSPCRF